jgi:putative chitinase
VKITPHNFATITASALLDATKYADPLLQAMTHFDINNPRRVAGFLGQLAHESQHFRHVEELLGYSAKRLMAVWPNRFPSLASTQGYAYNPEALANFVYANRMGNGSVDSGDGWRYRGRGLFQLTGLANYKAAQDALGLLLTGDNAYRVGLPDGAAWTAAWFWYSRNCNGLADRWDLATMTKAINGGLIGYEDGNTVGLDDRVEICTYALEQTRALAVAMFADEG